MDRVYLVNPGQKITLGDRTLTAIKPPAFDNPSTTGFYDDKSGCFSAPTVLEHSSRQFPRTQRTFPTRICGRGRCFGLQWTRRGCTKDSVALARTDGSASCSLQILSSHLPAAREMTERLLAAAAVLAAEPFVGRIRPQSRDVERDDRG
jgi:hypothetical protein